MLRRNDVGLVATEAMTAVAAADIELAIGLDAALAPAASVCTAVGEALLRLRSILPHSFEPL
jgi:hypothetical protein